MPMILLTVPAHADCQECVDVQKGVIDALRSAGVQSEIILWPLRIAFVPDRLLLEYKSPQEAGDLNVLAGIAAKVAANVFHVPVVPVVIKLELEDTGVCVTPD